VRLLSFGWINRLIQLFQKLRPNFLKVWRQLRNCKVKVAPTKTLESSHAGLSTLGASLPCGEFASRTTWLCQSDAPQSRLVVKFDISLASRAHLPAMLVDTSMAGSGGLYLPARGQGP
jgi:hypothetical protein